MFSLHTLFNRKRSDENELLSNKWACLEARWIDCKNSDIKTSQKEQAEIDSLFHNPLNANRTIGWKLYNVAEQRVGLCLENPLLKIDFENLVLVAEQRNIPSKDLHRKRLNLFCADDISAQRGAYLSLIKDLQADFITMRYLRDLRSEVSSRLFIYGTISLSLALLPPVIFLLYLSIYAVSISPPEYRGYFSDSTLVIGKSFYVIAMVGSAGILGAYFSRVITFQSNLRNLNFDDVSNMFVSKIIGTRLLVGLIGALIFYFLVLSKILAGTVFPVDSDEGLSGEILWRSASSGLEKLKSTHSMVFSGAVVNTPSANFAKLLIWSFIAGFSERLVPDSLAKVGDAADHSSRPS